MQAGRSLIAILCFILMGIHHVVLAQQKPRPAPTPQEMEQMKKKMQAELDKLTPEQKKKMAEMGITLPTSEALDNANNNAQSNPGSRRTEMPVKDAARIASIPATPTKANVATYIQKVHQQAAARLGREVAERGEKLYADLQTRKISVREMGHAASGLWVAGRYEEAIYLEGKICSMNQGDVDNLNNYAAFLTMAGAEQAAIPLLRMLNATYPNNSTVLNNLGQAWFGLGDFGMANRYLDSALRFFPGHAQANFTKSQIEESKGNTQAAVEAMKKSQDNGYSVEKETRLRKLGYPVDKGDVSWPLHIPQDALGLDKIALPGFPKDVKESEDLVQTWEDFRKRIRSEMESLQEKKYRLDAASNEYQARQVDQVMRTWRTGGGVAAPGPMSLRAQRKLSYLMDDKDGSLNFKWKKAQEDYVNRAIKLKDIVAARNERSRQIEVQFKDLFGEGGSKYTMKDYCTAVDQMNSDYLAAANAVEEQSINTMLDMLKKWINTQAYYNQYILPEPMFEAAKAEYKLLWLGVLETLGPQFFSPHPECDKDKPPFKPSKLQDFDDVACRYHSEMDFKFFSITTDCSRMTTKFKAGPIDFSIKEDLVKNEIMRGSLEVSAGKGVGAELGPVQAEVKGKIKGRIEFDETGITDAIVAVEVEVEVSSNVVPKEKDVLGPLGRGDIPIVPEGKGEIGGTIAGVEGRMGWNSGSSVSGKGMLQGIQIK